MAIISAGVIMNVILAFGCFAFYYSQSTSRAAAGSRGRDGRFAGLPGGPSTGDEIVAIDGRRNLAFADLLETVVLSSSGQVLHFQVNRPGQDGSIDVDLEASADENSDRPTIGVVATHSMELAGILPLPGMEVASSLRRDSRKGATDEGRRDRCRWPQGGRARAPARADGLPATHGEVPRSRPYVAHRAHQAVRRRRTWRRAHCGI